MRREFSKPIMRDAFNRAGGKCEHCTRKLYTGDIHYDHRIPDAMGGEPTLANCQVLCRSCHSVKTTKADVPAIAKAKRLEDKRLGIKLRKSRPMPGSRASGIKRKFDGTVERRDAR